MDQELLFCRVCGYYCELKYHDETITSEEKCYCKTKPKLINGMKPLDVAIKKIGEILNEKPNYRPRKVSKRS